MKHTSPTLLVIAALATVNGLCALDVKDDDLKIGLKLQLQVRAEKSWAKGTDAQRYNVTEGSASTEPDDMDFYIRRARIGFAGTWKGEYKFAYLLRNDDQDKTSTARTPSTHVAYIERLIKQEDLGIEHGIRAGLDYAWFNGSNAVFSSSSFLFPTGRASTDMLAPRGTGVGYKLTSKMVSWGVDVQNNTGDSALVGTQGSANQGEGLFYGTRVQVIPFDSDDKGHMKPVESFLGKEGKGVLISAEFGVNQNDNTSTTATVTTKGYGFEVLGHLDGLTALAEYRQTIATTTSSVAATQEDVNVATVYLVQAGYALPCGDQIIEPAFRWTHLNNDADADEAVNYGTREYGASGNSFDLGVNYYIHGHANKLQIALQHWRSEGHSNVGSDLVQPKADIVRAQWQLSF